MDNRTGFNDQRPASQKKTKPLLKLTGASTTKEDPLKKNFYDLKANYKKNAFIEPLICQSRNLADEWTEKFYRSLIVVADGLNKTLSKVNPLKDQINQYLVGHYSCPSMSAVIRRYIPAEHLY